MVIEFQYDYVCVTLRAFAHWVNVCIVMSRSASLSMMSDFKRPYMLGTLITVN